MRINSIGVCNLKKEQKKQLNNNPNFIGVRFSIDKNLLISSGNQNFKVTESLTKFAKNFNEIYLPIVLRCLLKNQEKNGMLDNTSSYPMLLKKLSDTEIDVELGINEDVEPGFISDDPLGLYDFPDIFKWNLIANLDNKSYKISEKPIWSFQYKEPDEISILELLKKINTQQSLSSDSENPLYSFSKKLLQDYVFKE